MVDIPENSPSHVPPANDPDADDGYPDDGVDGVFPDDIKKFKNVI